MAARKRQPPKKKPAPAAAAALAPSSEPSLPGPRLMVLPRPPATVRVTEDTALTLGAVFACVRVISESLAGLPWNVFRRRPDGGREDTPDDPADWIISRQANPETPAFFWREVMTAHALLWGNGYAEIERDAAGRPLWLWQITPDRVSEQRDAAGRLYYTVRNPSGPNTELDARDVFHLRGPSWDGISGYPVVRYAARTIGLGIGLDDASASLVGNDSTPGGVLKHPQRLSEPARVNLRESFQRRHGGPSNRRTVAILEEGMEWQQTGLPPEDLQLLQQRQYTPAEVCRWFRVPPHKIGDLTRATFSNIEQQSIDFVGDALLPWAHRLECEADVKLFGRVNRGRLFTRMDFNSLLRGDSAARSNYYRAMTNIGALDVDEVRDEEGLNPIGEKAGGRKRFVPLAMQLLEKAGDEPPAPKSPPGLPGPRPPGPPAPGQPPPPPTAKPPAPQAQAFRPVFADAFARALSRESHRCGDARKRLTPGAYTAWLADQFWPEHRDWLAAALAPGLDGWGAGPACRAGALASALEEYRLDLGRVSPDTPGLAGLFAGSLLQALESLCGGPGSGVPGPCPAGGGKTAVGPSKKDERKEGDIPVKEFVPPPAPLGVKGGNKAGGFTANGETNTKMGDVAEKALEKLELRSILPDGHRQNPLDVEFDHSGRAYEVKACSTTATEYKCAPKKEELESKKAYAEKHDLKGGVIIPVVDRQAGVMHVYSREGLASVKLNPNTAKANGWRYHGTVSLAD